MTDQELKDWLNQEPENPSQNDDGSEYVDIVQVENDLSEIDVCWSTTNFQARFAKKEGVAYISGSVELKLAMFGRLRTLVGAATLRLSEDITHSEAILKSECIKNAAKALGKKFGKYLNDRGAQPSQEAPARPKASRQAVRMKADAGVMKQYLKAITEGDTEMIEKLTTRYQINTEDATQS